MQKKIFILIFVGFIDLSLTAQVLFNNTGHIPAGSKIDWSHAGLVNDITLTQADTVFNIIRMPGSTWDDKLASAMLNAKEHAGTCIIYFPKGIYLFRHGIVLDENHSNIIFQGAGSDATILQFEIGRDGVGFTLQGQTGSHIDLESISKGSHFLLPALKSDFNVNDWIRFVEYDFPTRDNADPKNIVGQISQITFVAAQQDTIFIKDETSKRYSSEHTFRLEKIYPVLNVGFENFKIVRLDAKRSTPDSYDKGSNFVFDRAVNCWMKGVESEQTCRHHVHMRRCSHFLIAGCYFHQAQSHGGNSYGYGMSCEASSTNCLIENNMFKHLRHAMGISAGANTNVFAFNYCYDQYSTFWGIPYPDSDICIHGKYSFANLFEHNKVEFIEADNEHGLNGPYNTFVRNFSYRSGEIFLYHSPDFSALGNVRDIQMNACTIESRKCSAAVDIFALSHSDDELLTHTECSDGNKACSNAELRDVSYYYSSRPHFLSPLFTWPALGPVTTDVTPVNSIPAQARAVQDIKTAIDHLTPHPDSDKENLN